MSRVDPVYGSENRNEPSKAVYLDFQERIEMHSQILFESPSSQRANRAKSELSQIKEELIFFTQSGFKGLGPLLNHPAFEKI